MNSLGEWLEDEDNRKQLNCSDLHNFYHLLNTNKVALTAGNLFPITYSLLGSVSTHVVILRNKSTCSGFYLWFIIDI